jgi:hypothetical protein
MNEEINNIKQKVIELSNNKLFIHHNWFVKYHLEIVEELSIKYSKLYKNINISIILLLVWIHDYEKITSNIPNSDSLNNFLQKNISDEKIIEEILSYYKIFESKNIELIKDSPIEIQIVSSCDAVSHLIGPFFYLWWKENNNKNFEDLMADNIKKLEKDWNKKISIQKIKDDFKHFYEITTNQNTIR